MKYAAINFNYNLLSDSELIALSLSGSQSARSNLITRHENLLHFVLRRYFSDPETVKDVVQDTYLRAMNALPGFRAESKFSTWLCKIAVSVAIDRLQRKRYMRWEPLAFSALLQQPDCLDNEVVLEKKETYAQLRSALNKLSAQDHAVIDLFYFKEHSIEEISQITGWSNANIKSKLSRARTRLRGALTC
jgi:RNA polymerase sigma-70 factor, ECF subfamily